ncbi:hypothetical protein ACJX0J_002980, partial (mitochondrion) [Zea mays]
QVGQSHIIEIQIRYQKSHKEIDDSLTLLSFLYQRIKSTFGILLPSFGSRGMGHGSCSFFPLWMEKKKGYRGQIAGRVVVVTNWLKAGGIGICYDKRGTNSYTICYINRYGGQNK